MIFKKGQRCKELPAHSEVIAVYLLTAHGTYTILMTSMGALEQERREPRATERKSYIVAVSENGFLHIHPEPKEKIKLLVRYTPPVKEC